MSDSLNPTAALSARGRFLLLPEHVESDALGSGSDAERPRIRRYRLTRVGAPGGLGELNPGPRRAGDFSHLRRLHD